MNNVIIFGGAGFIGTNLTKRCIDRGDKVLCIDNLCTGRLSNIYEFELNKNFKFQALDITNKNLLNQVLPLNINLFLNGKVDEIYNLACPASPPKYQKEPLFTIHTSLAVEDICKLAIKYNSKLLHASTSEVYGDPLVHPQAEEYKGNVNTFGSRACYDEGKRIAETILYEYSKLKCRVKVIRIFNTYGPYMDPTDGRVISNFICQAIQRNPITIYGNGTQTRSFQYIDDLLNGIDAVMSTDDEFTGPVNIGSHFEFAINDLVAEIQKNFGYELKLEFKELPEDDPKQRKADISKLHMMTGWEPKVSLQEGIVKTIQYFKSLKISEVNE